VKRWGWLAAALLAGGFLAALALHGERPDPGLARFIALGPLADLPVEEVASVEAGSATHRQMFHREAGGWRVETATVPAEIAASIDTGLMLLHNSAPQRTDLAGDLAEFGLAPPRLVVTVYTSGGAAMTVEFGDSNPLGLERYARIVGRAEIMTLPAFVAAAWGHVAGTE